MYFQIFSPWHGWVLKSPISIFQWTSKMKWLESKKAFWIYYSKVKLCSLKRMCEIWNHFAIWMTAFKWLDKPHVMLMNLKVVQQIITYFQVQLLQSAKLILQSNECNFLFTENKFIFMAKNSPWSIAAPQKKICIIHPPLLLGSINSNPSVRSRFACTVLLTKHSGVIWKMV